MWGFNDNVTPFISVLRVDKASDCEAKQIGTKKYSPTSRKFSLKESQTSSLSRA